MSIVLLVIGVFLLGILLPEYLVILSGKVVEIPFGQNILTGIAFACIAISQNI